MGFPLGGENLVRNESEVFCMFNKLIVGFDGSPQSLDALALAQILMAPDGELVVCCVYRSQSLSARVDPTEPHLDRRAAETNAQEAMSFIDASHTAISLVLAGASAAGALQGSAEQRHTDLLVVGSSHRGTVGRVLVGSVTEETLHGAPCPVAIAPVGFRYRVGGSHLARIAVGCDIAATARDALQAAATLALQMGSELRIIAVADTAAALAGGANASMSYVHAAEEAAAKALAALPEGISASSEVRDGEASEKLLEVTHGVDLLVVGSRGRGPVRRLVLGSVCDRLVRAAACPVLIVTPAEEAEEAQRENDAFARA
jgi:nucleotide-binding universal stress UspA family protein